MVNSKEQARQYVHDTILRLAELPVFNEKVDIMNALLDLEWNLRENDNFILEDPIDEEIRGGIENPWSD
jgi:hypothetical protein